MGRSRKQDSGILDTLFDIFTMVPVWVGPIVAGIVFACIRWGLPWVCSEPDPKNLIQKTLYNVNSSLGPMLAPWIVLLIIIVWAAAEVRKRSDSKRLHAQSGLDSIRALNWKSFERLLAEAFRRQGYEVPYRDSSGPDGGVDLELSKSGQRTLVQCKQWKTRSVGVKVIRELRGVMASENASAGIVVTSGSFTAEAVKFARDNSIELIDGSQLEPMIRAVQNTAPEVPVPVTKVTESPARSNPNCPTCNAEMRLRTARQGANPGSHFWGCSRYPQCRGTRPFSVSA